MKCYYMCARIKGIRGGGAGNLLSRRERSLWFILLLPSLHDVPSVVVEVDFARSVVLAQDAADIGNRYTLTFNRSIKNKVPGADGFFFYA